jgi:hypothetical protein
MRYATIDIAQNLVEEFAQWFSNLGANGAVPRAFTGVKQDERQFITILSGISLDHVARRNYLIWLCRKEDVVAHAYGTHVAVADDKIDPPKLSEAVCISSSSSVLNVSLTMNLTRSSDGKITYPCIRRLTLAPECDWVTRKPDTKMWRFSHSCSIKRC